MTQSLPPVCSGVPAPSQHGFFAAQLFPHGASPATERGTWSALPCPAQFPAGAPSTLPGQRYSQFSP